jgi:hypothetical protein
MEPVNRQKQTSTPRILSQFSDHVEAIALVKYIVGGEQSGDFL